MTLHAGYFDDTWIIVGDANVQLTNILYSTTKRFHPFAFLPFYPLFDFIFFTTKDFLLSVFIIYTLVISATVGILYKILEIINNNNLKLNILLTLIFGFSWSCIIFNYSYDVYVFSSFYLAIIFYLILKEYKNSEISVKNSVLIGIFASFSFGVNLQNICTIMILLLPFLHTKKRKSILIILSTFLAVSALCIFLKTAVCNQSVINYFLGNKFLGEYHYHMNFDIQKNLKFFYNSTVLSPIVSDFILFNTIFSSFLFCNLIGFFAAFSSKIKKTDKKIYFSIILTLLFNYVSVFFWCSTAGLLFSLNYLVLLFILTGYSVYFINLYTSNFKITNNKFLLVAVLLFVIFLAHYNYNYNRDFQNMILETHPLKTKLLEIE
jgi:hypothetical protein